MILELIISTNVFAAVPVKDLLTLPQKNRMQVAASLKSDISQDLFKVVDDENESMPNRWNAMTLAAFTQKAKVKEQIKSYLTSKTWYLRNASLISLQSMDAKEAEQAAIKLLKDKALVVRSAAVRVLAQNLSEKNRELLWEELSQKYNFRKKQSLWIRSEILTVLAQKPIEREKQYFQELAKDKNKELAKTAQLALKNLIK